MRKRLEQRFLPVSSQPSQTGNTQAQAVANSPIDEKLELEQANVLYSLLENRYSRKVCFTLTRRLWVLRDWSVWRKEADGLWMHSIR